MDSASLAAGVVELQKAFATLSTLMLTSHLFPKSTKLKDGDEFDFLIIGGGTSGCVIANRLMKANFTVLVLEAGDDKPYEALLPGTLVLLPQSRLDWNYTAVPDNFTGRCHRCKSVELTTGKVLGGSGSVNYMNIARGNYRDYHRWAIAANDSSWEFKHLIHLFIRNERLLAPKIANSPLGRCRGIGGNPAEKGGEGYVGIGVDNGTIIETYLRAFEEMGNELVLDLNGKHSTGYTRTLFNIADGYRQSTAYAYVTPAYLKDSETNPKLYLSKNTLVTKIIFDDKKNAIGVMASIKNQKPIFLKAKKEVVLSAGAIKSPQLLMLSGIGRRNHLEQKNITVISDLPVGENFQDHIAVTVVHRTRRLQPNISTDYRAFPANALVGFKSLDLCGEYPDYGTITYIEDKQIYLPQYCAISFNFQYEICDRLYQQVGDREIAYTQIYNAYPKSRGKVLLNTLNPHDAPIVDAGYFTHKDDIENTIKYLKDFLPIENSTFFSNSGGNRTDPIGDKCGSMTDSYDYWRCYAYCMSSSLWNYCGTCSMGAVVDSKLKVFGVQRLRVADASIMPSIIAGGNYMSCVVIGEKVSDMIKEEWKQ